MRIFTVTLNTAIDVVISEKDYEKNGEKNAVLIPAGKGINVSRALASAGVPSTTIALVGEEELALFNTLSNKYITTDFIAVKGNTRRNLTITDTSDGSEKHVRTTGYRVTSEEIRLVYNKLLQVVSEGDWVFFSGSLPHGAGVGAYVPLIRLCKRKGAYTGLDSSGSALLSAAASSPYFLKPNMEELEEMNGEPFENEEEFKDCIKRVSSYYDIPVILATSNSSGAALYTFDRDEFMSVPALEVKRAIVSSVGCGDAAVAGFMAAMLRREDNKEALHEAMRFANANLYTNVPGELYFEDEE